MFKRLFFLLLICLMPLMILTGFSSWIIIAEESATIGMTQTSGPVAFIQNQEDIKYTSINAAIRAADSKNPSLSNKINIIVIPGSTININESITLRSGINLYIPYELTYDTNGNYTGYRYDTKSNEIEQLTYSGFADSNSSKVSTNRQTLINLRKGADINIEYGASLYLGAQCKTIGVVGKYTEINLDSKSMINCSGSFYCYGYVKENKSTYKNGSQENYKTKYDNSYDEGRLLKINNGGYLLTPIGMYDMKTASELTLLNDLNIFPLNIFDFPNLQTYTEICYGSKFVAQTYLLATSSQANLPVYEEIIVMEKSSGLFHLSSGTASFEYCPSSIEYTSNNSVTRIYVFGEIEQGVASLDIEAPIVGKQTVSTENKFLPLSYKFNLFINKGGIYTTNHKVKCLPGFVFKINSGGLININSEVIFYDGASNTKIGNYANSTDAILINNGTINLLSLGKLGAFIQTEIKNNTALLNFEKVVSSDSFSVTCVEGENTETISIVSQGYFVDTSDDGKSLYQFVAGSKVYSDSNGGQCWDGDKFSLMNLMIDIIETNYAVNLFSYEIYSADDSNGKNKVPLTSGVQTSEGTYGIPFGKYVNINVKRAKNASFDNGNNVDSSVWYYVSENMKITIEPNEGIKLTVSTVGDSGNGKTSFTVYESSNESSGFYEIVKYTAITKESTYIVKGYWFKISVDGNSVPLEGTTQLDSSKFTITPLNGSASKFVADKAYQADDEYTVHFPRKSACIAAGSLITTADGSMKKVEDIKPGDSILSFNHETGKQEIKPVMFNAHDDMKWEYMDVINLKFNDGTKLKVINEHALFNTSINKYIYINEETYKDYIGDSFYAGNYNGSTFNRKDKILVDAYITNEYTGIYSPITHYNLNHYAEGLLTAAGGDIKPILNIFKYDDDLKYNEEDMKYNIDKYGLYTYDDFKDYYSYDIYSCLQLQYMKIVVGRGEITFEEIIDIVDRNVIDNLPKDYEKS